MKIAVVSSIFIPGLGYLEEGITEVLTGMGHNITVFTSTHYPINGPNQNRQFLPQHAQDVIIPGSESHYHVIRLKTFLKIRSNIVCLGLRRSILKLNPDLVILVGVSDFFPINIIKKNFCNRFRTFAFIGQNYDMSHWRKSNPLNKRILSYLINNLIKGFLFRRSVRFLSKLILYTPDSEEIISKFLTYRLNKKLQLKKAVITLGYNSDYFYYSHSSRNQIRSRLGIAPGKVIFITATRIDESKKIKEIINSLFLVNKLDVIYILIGFIDNHYKKEVENLIEQNNLQGKVLCLPFMSYKSLADYFSASDFGIWLQSGASIQQAMGSGLPLFLSKNSTTSLLLQEGYNGYYVENNLDKTITTALSSYSFNLEQRRMIEQHNKANYSYQSILQRLIA